MLTELTVKNFRCLRDVTVPLKPLTVLIGPNDSGKSTLLAVMDLLLNERVRQSGIPLGLPREDHWGFEVRNTVFAEAESSDWLARVTAVGESEPIMMGPRGDLRQYTFERGVPRLRSSRIEVNPSELRFSGEQVLHDVPFNAVELTSDGSNVPGLLDKMLRSHRPRFAAVVDACRDLIPGFSDFSINLPAHGKVELYIWLDSGIELPTTRTSDGVRALIFYLTLAHRPRPPGRRAGRGAGERRPPGTAGGDHETAAPVDRAEGR